MEDRGQASKKAKVVAVPTLGFLEEDKEGAFQPHDDALVVTLWIKGYDMKRWTKGVEQRLCTQICIKG